MAILPHESSHINFKPHPATSKNEEAEQDEPRQPPFSSSVAVSWLSIGGGVCSLTLCQKLRDASSGYSIDDRRRLFRLHELGMPDFIARHEEESLDGSTAWRAASGGRLRTSSRAATLCDLRATSRYWILGAPFRDPNDAGRGAAIRTLASGRAHFGSVEGDHFPSEFLSARLLRHQGFKRTASGQDRLD